MKALIVVVFLFIGSPVLGQKFMIVGKDTLPFKPTMQVTYDTSHRNGQTYITADTVFIDPCQAFEKRYGKIINRTDSSCRQQGLWFYPQKDGTYLTSSYTDGDDGGVTQYYNKAGKLVKEKESVEFGREYYTIKETDYTSAGPVVKINRPISGFYIRHFSAALIWGMILFFLRIMFNNNIYNDENDTDFSAFANRLFLHPYSRERNIHGLKCLFTIWFFNYKPGNKIPVWISNSLSAFFLINIVLVILW